MKPHTLTLLLAAITAASLSVSAQTAKQAPLRYHNNGKFRIAQLTDIHWCDDSTQLCQRTLQAAQAVYDKGKPDLVVVTGDVVVDAPIIKGWKAIISFLDSQRVPYIIAMGNHDCEFFRRSADEFAQAKKDYAGTGLDDDAIAKDRIYTMLMQSPYYVGDKGCQVSGYGNVALPIYGKKGSEEVKNVIYVLDSHDYPKYKFDGYYDWIHTDQVAWYRQQSQQFTAANGGKPVPSLAFFHIPLLEVAEIRHNDNTVGNMLETDASAEVNSGLFVNMYEQGDIMGIFVGHDHGNDFVGVHHGIALGYGRCTGYNASGILERGGRVFELNEDSRLFTTNVITPSEIGPTVYLPDGINSAEEERGDYQSALNVKATKHGVAYKYYEGEFQKVADMANIKPKAQGTMPVIDITKAPASDHFGYEFNTLLQVDQKAIYRFRMFSDDGAKLYIDGKQVVNLDGSHSTRLGAGKIALEAGLHHLRLLYFEDYMGEELGLYYSARHLTEQTIPADKLFLPVSDK